MNKIIVKHDGLYKGGVKQKLEFGNVEQINAIREHAKSFEMLQSEDGLEVDVDFDIQVEATTNFKCLCGSYVYVSMSVDEEDDISEFIGTKKECRHCKRKYKFHKGDFDELIVKLIV